ncbi:MAG: phospho-N-acetylmuramoyl-pentapeptide-transferase [Phycisphaerae bacterium]|jgi:phospho-N-acetylmuramoyl-pentapeptide-transferase
MGQPTGAYAYKDALFRGTCAILLSFLVVWLLGPRVIRELMRRKVGDQAEFDHKALNELAKDKKNTPTMGGILIIAAIFASVILLADLQNYYIRMGLFCMGWLGAIGFWDDRLKINPRTRSGTRDGLKTYQKLLFQIGLGVLLGIFVYKWGEQNTVHLGGEVDTFRILSVPFYKHGITLSLPAFWVITVLVTTGTSNAVNLTDGMDGLAAGCMALCSFVFMVLSFLVGDPGRAESLLLPHIPHTAELAVLCGAIMGSCLGFLWYNCYPAGVFMGDTGSLPLGGLIGYVAIVTRQELMLFIVGGIFVIEAMSVLLQVGYFKATGGKRIFRIAPIHHHFHLGGWTETQTVTRFWLLAAVFAGIALATIRLR